MAEVVGEGLADGEEGAAGVRRGDGEAAGDGGVGGGVGEAEEGGGEDAVGGDVGEGGGEGGGEEVEEMGEGGLQHAEGVEPLGIGDGAEAAEPGVTVRRRERRRGRVGDDG